MALRVDLTFDRARAQELAEFWKPALGYEDEPPPSGMDPRLVFLEVPEPKVAKNRLHIDVRVGRSADPGPRITAKVAELVAAGGRVLARYEGHHVVMADPEGNEFCVAA
ncbi:MAG TPA: VOC family protein [Actinoplanes sp.]|nr:VOC family protein [Actinoplanes sp.]